MFSEIKHPHFKLHPQGHGGFAETLAGLFRGGGVVEGGNLGPRGLQCVGGLLGRFGRVFTPFRNQLPSPEWAPKPPRIVRGSAGQERRGGRDGDYAVAGPSPPSHTWVCEADAESWQAAPSTRCQQ